MAEFNKSNEEIALELFKEILNIKHSSGTSVRSVLEEIDIRQSSLEARCKWLLELFANCLLTVNNKTESKQ